MRRPEDVRAIQEELYDQTDFWQALQDKLGTTNVDPSALIDVKSLMDKVPLSDIPLIGRGASAKIENGGIPEQLNKYLIYLIAATGGPRGPIGLQFVAQTDKERASSDSDHITFIDSLEEDNYRFEDAPCIVHKYSNRVLFITTDTCAAYCRHCTRAREVGEEPPKTLEEIDKSFDWIEQHPDIREIIFSGGDPFTLPPAHFKHIIDRVIELQKVDRLDSVRFGTRALVHTGRVGTLYIHELSRLLLPPNIMLHLCHPAEITQQVLLGIQQFKSIGANVWSQSVLLAGINNDRQVLKQLFIKMQKHGIIPYYLFTCDPVEWATHFQVTYEEAIDLMQYLRAELPGLAATAQMVIDVPGENGVGKIPVQQGFWESDRVFRDYKGNRFQVSGYNVLPMREQKSEPSQNTGATTVFQSASMYD